MLCQINYYHTILIKLIINITGTYHTNRILKTYNLPHYIVFIDFLHMKWVQFPKIIKNNEITVI